MTNREYAIKKINEVLEQVDDTRLADIIIEVIQFPDACEGADEASCSNRKQLTYFCVQSETLSDKFLLKLFDTSSQ